MKLVLCMKIVSRSLLFVYVVCWTQAAVFSADEKSSTVYVYVGTYTNKDAKGIYCYRLNSDTGKLTDQRLVAESKSPSFLAIHPNGRFLYAVNESEAAVSSFAIDRSTGALTFLNQQPSRGPSPCHLVVDQTGHCVLVANYSGGSVAALPIEANGSLGSPSAYHQHRGQPVRTPGAHAHSINVDPANRFAFAADLGLDKIFIYRLDAQRGTLVVHDPGSVSTPGDAGPRHFAFRPDAKYAYLINETNNTVIAYSFDTTHGSLTEIQTIRTLPEGYEQQSWTSEIQVHTSGRFVYGSNRGHNSIVVYAVDQESGRLTLVELEPTQGKMPRGFGMDPTGRFLFVGNQETDTIVNFRIDQQTGALEPTGDSIDLSMPVCIKFLSIDGS